MNDNKEQIQFNDWELNNNGYNGYNNYNNGYNNNYGYEPPILIDEEKERGNMSRIGFGFAAFSIISLAVSLIINIIVLIAFPDFAQTTLFMNILAPVSMYVFALPVLLIMILKCPASVPQKRKMGFGKFLLFLLVCFGFMYIGSFVGNFVMELISVYMGYDYSNALNNIIDYDNLWITAIFTVIVAPIGEEFVFRKLVIDRTHKYGGFVSVFLSGLMFGLMHGNFYQFFYAFAIGVILGYIYYNTGKIHLTIIIHAIINFVGSILSSLLLPTIEKLEEIDLSDMDAMLNFVNENYVAMAAISIFEIFVFGAIICAIVLPVVFRRKIRFERAEMQIPRGKVMKIIYGNAGTITMLAIYGVSFALALIPA